MPRIALLAALAEHDGVVVIRAAAGYGKTALLEQARAVAGDRWGWVPPEPTILDGILADPPRAGERVSIAVDDYVPGLNRALDDALRGLVDARPEGVVIIISGRRAPPMDLGRVRASGALLELGPSHLAFSAGEARELLRLRGLNPSDETMAELERRFEGWPAGLALAASALGGAAHPEPSRLPLRDADRHASALVREEMLRDLEPWARSLIDTSAVLGRVSGRECDDLLGRTGSAAVLADLRDGGLMVALDEQGDHFRCAPFVVRAVGPSPEADALRTRAAERLAADGDVGEAVRHLLAAGNSERAAALVAERYMSAVERGDVIAVAGWLERFPRSLVTSDGRLAVVEAWTMSFMGRPAEARAALDNARASGLAGPLPDGASSVDASAALIEAGFPGGDIGRMCAGAERAFALEDRPDSPWRTTVHVLLGIALHFRGDPGQAGPLLERGAALARASERPLEETGARCVRAWGLLAEGRTDLAREVVEEAGRAASAGGLDESAYAGYVDATRGAVLGAEGWPEEGAVALERGLAAMESGIEPLMLAQCWVELAEVRLVLGRPALAEAATDEAGRHLSDFRDAGAVGARLEAVRERVALARRRPAPAALTRRESDVLALLAEGLTKREVADRLVVSYSTVHSHCKSLYRKMGATTREDVLRRAREADLL